LKWAAANDERTIVSTNTINLQEQLFGKDLPFLARAFGDSSPVRFALLKGWRNYLCLQRLEQTESIGSGLFEEGSARELEMLRAWASSTKDGSLADLPTPPRAEVWDEVAAEGDLCTRTKCPHFDRCFVFAARRKAANADVIVVNHHLLLSDLAVRRANGNWTEAAVLPAYKRLVVDEGHHLEDVAAHHLGASVSRLGLQRLFARLDRRGRGLLPALEARLGGRDDLLSTASLDLVRARLVPSVGTARAHGLELFERLGTLLNDDRETVVRLTDDFKTHPIWDNGLRTALDDLLEELGLIETGLKMIRERMRADAEHLENVAQIVNEIAGVSRRLTAAGEGLVRALRPRQGGEPTVRWVERRGRERNVAVTAVPLDVAPVLRDDLWRRLESAVVTSATLAQRSDFSFIERQLGIDDPELASRSAVFTSPFRFERQALLVIPTDIPAPNVDAAGHRDAVVAIARDLGTVTDGGLFVLFTSHKEVRHTAEMLRSGGVSWPVLMHGEDSRDALLRRFRESGRAVLVGTASFWEGVDVPGSALRGLVIAKLPFRVPSEPITAAQCETIEARGGDPFTEYMLPHATLRLKQGFGRLIRTARDRGVVVLCDPRVTTKRYGRTMLEALPPARRIVAPWRRLAAELERFYEDQEDF
jgi:ATP-dependent DNA helicase DinG